MRAIEIIKLRLSLGMSQEEFATMLGVHQTTVSKWELGGNVSGLAYAALIRLKKEKAAERHIRALGGLAEAADTALTEIIERRPRPKPPT